MATLARKMSFYSLAVSFALVTTVTLLAFASSYKSILFKHVGPIQVLGSNDELYIFLEIRWLVRTPNPFTSPRVLTVAHEQYVIRADQDGWKPSVRIPSLHGVTFNENVTWLARHNQSFYAITYEDHSQPAVVYRWDGEGFAKQDAQASLRFEENVGIDGTLRVDEIIRRLDENTQRTGWDVLLRENHPFAIWEYEGHEDPLESDVRFHWRNQEYVIVRGKDEINAVLLVGVRVPFPREPHVLVAFDASDHPISKDELNRIRGKKEN